MNVRPLLLTGVLSLMLVGCADDGKSEEASTNNGDGDGDGSTGQETTMTTAEGDGDGDTGDGDGDTGDGDGDSGDGDGDSGDGDGDSGDGDGDGDYGDGDGDGDSGDGDGDTGDGDGDACSNQGQSCANGEACCGNLDCCQGVPVPPGAEYCSNMCPISDRNLKFGFQTVDSQWVLDQVVELPISTWSYKSGKDGNARHIGPMAQDFHAAFDVGASDRYIFQIDADGVSFAAIKALDAKVDALEAENQQLRSTLLELEARLDKLER
jgi:outer membrane murein-binding lipoprotein Lpp